MARIIGVIQTVLPVLLVLCIGMLCRGKGILSREGVNALKRVAVDITLPAVLLEAFATADYGARSVAVPLLMYAVCILGFFLGKAANRFMRLPSRFTPFLTTGFEAGMLGYTLFTMLYGAQHVANFALVDLGQVLFVFTLYKALLKKDTTAPGAQGSLVREMLTSPIIISIVVGVALGATGLYRALIPSGISALFDASVSFISAPTSVLILISVGYDLCFSQIRWRETFKMTATRLVIMLLLMGATMGAVWALFGKDMMLIKAIAVMFILPPPFVLPVFADDSEHRAYISSVLSFSTLTAIALFAVLAAIG